MVAAAERQFGPLTTLVNNAAATHMIGTAHPHADKRMHLLSNETLDIIWRSDLYGFFWCCRYALRAMLAHGTPGCSIVNISSGAGNGVGGDMDAYVASKAAMNSITKSMAGEYAYAGIRVNAIVLGLINNGGGVAAILAKPEIAEAMTRHIPMGVVGAPDDIAWGAVYLASDQARYVTGALLADRRRRRAGRHDRCDRRQRLGRAQALTQTAAVRRLGFQYARAAAVP